MNKQLIPAIIANFINGAEQQASNEKLLAKYDPATGNKLCDVHCSVQEDVETAVAAAHAAQEAWANTTPVARGKLLLTIAQAMQEQKQAIASIVAQETGKSFNDALGETSAAIQLAEFFAGEGMRLQGRTFPSGQANKYTMTVRQPLGVAGLIIAANTPIANVAWKVFPALICGNAAVVKAAEDTPATAWFFAKLLHAAGLPAGVLNVIQGLGAECGEALVHNEKVDVISFTGSTAVGRHVAEVAGKRLARVSLELGGKNPLVVCDDADLDNAVKWTVSSSFSNAGQRCAASSRIIVFAHVYAKFRELLLQLTSELKLGNSAEDDLGPVINQCQLDSMLTAVAAAKSAGATVLCGGAQAEEKGAGYYMQPTLLENVPADHAIHDTELFGPIAVLYRVENFAECVQIANQTAYGLTASIHTKNIDRAIQFTQKVRAGTVNVNIGTYGSEAHFPFGGFGASGNGTREPGVEALDVYSELKVISLTVDEANL